MLPVQVAIKKRLLKNTCFHLFFSRFCSLSLHLLLFLMLFVHIIWSLTSSKICSIYFCCGSTWTQVYVDFDKLWAFDEFKLWFSFHQLLFLYSFVFELEGIQLLCQTLSFNCLSDFFLLHIYRFCLQFWFSLSFSIRFPSIHRTFTASWRSDMKCKILAWFHVQFSQFVDLYILFHKMLISVCIVSL